MRRSFALFVALAMVGGVATGWAINAGVRDPATLKAIAQDLSLVTDIFLRLIRMIIAPLVFSTLVVGVAHMDDGAAVGRIGAKTLGWFLGASVVSLLFGLMMVHLLRPGEALHLHAAAGGARGAGENINLRDFIAHLVPTSIAKAMADNEILQIVVFAVFFGLAIGAVEGRAPAIMALAEQTAQVMLKLTGYVMLFAPPAIFAALASAVATQGPSVLLAYAGFVGSFYLSLAGLWLVMLLVAFVLVGRRAPALAATAREPAMIAFSTASSEAAYPRLLEGLQAFGISRRIASFVLPLGYSFNLDGSMMYCTFATLFIAQAYGIPLSLGQQLTMLLLLMVTSKGIAGVPRAAIVVVAATLPVFRLPEAGLLLVLAVDHLLDMGRSATNVIGNSLAAAAVARWEGENMSEAAATQG
ncbi:MAG TPA: dicarboxylate/amino acid:cation symporter [Caulobacteraceae bacterium]|nr:dicarboxylate/amino acid:cation symporter [Caulobacteraceae bacterium]